MVTRAIALLGVVLTLAVVVASAWLRHGQAGVDCAGWPACYGRIAQPEAVGAATARLVHRVDAIGVLFVAVALAIAAFGQSAAGRFERRGSLVALALVVALAVLGIATPGARLPVVVLANLLGGFALLATFAAQCRSSRPAPAPGRGVRAAALGLLLAAFATAAAGALIGANFAVDACPALLDCGGVDWSGFARGGALDPLRPWQVVDGRVVTPTQAAGLHVLHRVAGVVLVAGVLLLAFALRRTRPALAGALAAAALLAPAAGVLEILRLPSRPATVLHNASAALLLALLAVAAASAAAPLDAGDDRGEAHE